MKYMELKKTTPLRINLLVFIFVLFINPNEQQILEYFADKDAHTT